MVLLGESTRKICTVKTPVLLSYQIRTNPKKTTKSNYETNYNYKENLLPLSIISHAGLVAIAGKSSAKQKHTY
jgi:hypothetical protein